MTDQAFQSERHGNRFSQQQGTLLDADNRTRGSPAQQQQQTSSSSKPFRCPHPMGTSSWTPSLDVPIQPEMVRTGNSSPQPSTTSKHHSLTVVTVQYEHEARI
eukprot:3065466-Amphidinium_carterae.1